MSYSKLLYHIVFSTKHRIKCIAEEYERELYTYIWGFLKNHGCVLYRVGGMPDHIHLILQVPLSIYLPDLMRDLKTSSNLYISAHKDKYPMFNGWGKSYCAVTVSYADKDKVIDYIKGQKEHHKKMSFKDELQSILSECGVEYDNKFLLAD